MTIHFREPNALSNFEVGLSPPVCVKCFSKSLCAFGFASARSDDFSYGDLKVCQDTLKLIERRREIAFKDCEGVGLKKRFVPNRL